MSDAEAGLMRQIQIACTADPDVRLFRNNVGQGWQGGPVKVWNDGSVTIYNARRIKFGLGVGTSDLIGWRSVEITPEMVGKRVAVFLAPEVKLPQANGKTPRVTKEQSHFVDAVNAAGGCGFIVDSVDAARALIRPQFVKDLPPYIKNRSQK